MAALQLDPWQQFVLEQSCAEDDGGRWAAFEVKLTVSRQNGKGAILEARELAGLYLFGEDVTHTAHEFVTSLDAFARILSDIESCPDLDSRVKRVSRAHGEEGIELKSGRKLRFRTRTNRGGRGLGGDLLVLDEDMYLPPAAMNALMPIVSARDNPQIWYTGSAPDAAEHPHAHVVAALRKRALAGGDPSLCFMEWSPDGLESPDDVAELDRAVRAGDPVAARRLEEAVAASNPGLGIRIRRGHVEKERTSMVLRSFAVERLSVGVYPTPEEDDRVIEPEVWEAAEDDASQASDPVAIAVDVTPDRSRSSIGIAGWRTDLRVHVEVIDDRAGTGWVVDRLEELVARWDPCVLLLDAGSPAASLVPAIEQRKLDVEVTTARQMANAVGSFYDDATQDRLRYVDRDRVLTSALAAAGTRALGDAWAWDRRGTTPIAPLVAVTLARWGLAVHGHVVAPPPPQGLPTEHSAASGGSGDLMTAGF